MTRIAVLTPSYAPDFELCCDLNESVLAHTASDVTHHLVVPNRDKVLFAELRGPRTEVWSVQDFMSRRTIALPGANAWLNVRAPGMPIRGWIMQQLVKLRAAAELDVDILLLADSDVRMVRPVTADTFRIAGQTRFFRSPAAVTEGMSRHVIWHDVAHYLLQLGPVSSPPPLPDYISPFNIWERRVVLMLKDRIEAGRRRSWLDEIGRQVHFSEFILYGVFVDLVLDGQGDARVAPSATTLCHCYWATRPLSLDAAKEFVAGRGSDDVAVMISAKSHTSLSVRRAALAGTTGTSVDEQVASDV